MAESFATVYRSVSVEAAFFFYRTYNAELITVKALLRTVAGRVSDACLSRQSLLSGRVAQMSSGHLSNIRVFPVNSSGSQIND